MALLRSLISLSLMESWNILWLIAALLFLILSSSLAIWRHECFEKSLCLHLTRLNRYCRVSTFRPGFSDKCNPISDRDFLSALPIIFTQYSVKPVPVRSKCKSWGLYLMNLVKQSVTKSSCSPFSCCHSWSSTLFLSNERAWDIMNYEGFEPSALLGEPILFSLLDSSLSFLFYVCFLTKGMSIKLLKAKPIDLMVLLSLRKRRSFAYCLVFKLFQLISIECMYLLFVISSINRSTQLSFKFAFTRINLLNWLRWFRFVRSNSTV